MEKKLNKMSLFVLSWPLFIELFLRMLMGSVDTLMLSHYSENAVASIGVANQIISFVIIMFGFVATGTSIVITQYLGAKWSDKANEVASVSINLNLLFGVLLSVVLVLFNSTFLNWMGLSAELLQDGKIYVMIVGGFIFLESLMITIAAIVRSHGYTKDAMMVTIGMNFIHVIGNYIALYTPLNLGIEGVAWSAVGSRCIALVVFIVLFIKRVNYRFQLKQFVSFPKKEMFNLLKIGVPSAGEHLSYHSSQMYITYFITMLGAHILTTKIYVYNIIMFIYLYSAAVSMGTQILIGYYIGSRKFDEAYHRCLKTLKLSVLTTLGIALCFSIVSPYIFRLFTNNPTIISVGTAVIWLTLLLEPGRCFNVVIINALKAAGDAKFPVYMGIASMWGISVPLSYILGIHYGLGLIGIFISFIIDEWLRGLIMFWRWKTRKWEQMSFVNEVKQEPAANI